MANCSCPPKKECGADVGRGDISSSHPLIQNIYIYNFAAAQVGGEYDIGKTKKIQRDNQAVLWKQIKT